MFLVQIKTIVTTGVIIFLGVGFALAVAVKIFDSDGGRDVAARERGGVFLGTDGVVMQNSWNTCGPAALRMVLEVFGRRALSDDFEKTPHGDRNGWSMLELQEHAERFGLQGMGWRISLKCLAKTRFPVILFVESGHFVVVDSVDARGFVFLRDPAIGRIRIKSRSLGKIWKGEALIFNKREIHKDTL
jgi:ABC-type bacteriocin/lantibiotic exporter with double-glycine peptidase domain